MKLFSAQVRDQTKIVLVEGQAVRAKRSVLESDHALKAQITYQALKASVSDSVQSSLVRPLSESKTSRSIKFSSDVPVSSSSSQNSQCILAVGRSIVDIDNSLREKINSLLRKEILYNDIIEEMESTKRNEIKRGQGKYKIQKKLLMIHAIGEPEDV